tara:strand:+ start:412 stop:630 length:219 start_codon:yes stop_codon:yes gene_type:complete
MLVEAKLRLFLIAKTPVKALFLPPKVCNCSFIKNHYILVGRRVICTIYSVLVKIKKILIIAIFGQILVFNEL